MNAGYLSGCLFITGLAAWVLGDAELALRGFIFSMPVGWLVYRERVTR